MEIDSILIIFLTSKKCGLGSWKIEERETWHKNSNRSNKGDRNGTLGRKLEGTNVKQIDCQ